MTAEAEITALQKLSAVDWDADGAYIYTRSFTPKYALQLEQELGDYMRKELKLQLREDGRKVMMSRSNAQMVLGIEGLSLNVRKRGMEV